MGSGHTFNKSIQAAGKTLTGFRTPRFARKGDMDKSPTFPGFSTPGKVFKTRVNINSTRYDTLRRNAYGTLCVQTKHIA